MYLLDTNHWWHPIFESCCMGIHPACVAGARPAGSKRRCRHAARCEFAAHVFPGRPAPLGRWGHKSHLMWLLWAGENVRWTGRSMPVWHARETCSNRRFAAVPVAWRARPRGRQRSRPSPAAGSPHLPSGCRPSAGEGRRRIHGTRRARHAAPSGATGACLSTERGRGKSVRQGRKCRASSKIPDVLSFVHLMLSGRPVEKRGWSLVAVMAAFCCRKSAKVHNMLPGCWAALAFQRAANGK